MCLHRIDIHNPIICKSTMENIKKPKYTKWNSKNLNKATLPKIFWLLLQNTYLFCNIILRKSSKKFFIQYNCIYNEERDIKIEHVVRMPAEAVCHMPCVFLFQFPVIRGWYLKNITYDGIFWSRIWKWSLVCVWEKRENIFKISVCKEKN